ncbi:diphthine--ammonia ligase [Thermococci archaeon]|nr:MAG: diphthine--ammonia ligase [Thermococci archaeon]
MTFRVISLLTGGKDSVYSLYYAISQGWEVLETLTICPKVDETLMYHYPNARLAELSSKAMGVRNYRLELDKQGEDKELEVLFSYLSDRRDVDGIVTGAIKSEYQRTRFDRVCEELGIRSISPLWRKDEMALLREMIEFGMEIIIVGISAEGLGKEWLGRKLDLNSLRNLERLSEEFGFNPSGEGGEFETLVVDAPFYRMKIDIIDYEVIWNGYSGIYLIRRAKLTRKNYQGVS